MPLRDYLKASMGWNRTEKPPFTEAGERNKDSKKVNKGREEKGDTLSTSYPIAPC